MCESCSNTIIDVMEKNFYEQMTEKRDDILDSDEAITYYREAFDTLLNSYSHFIESIFNGELENADEVIVNHQENWEQRFDSLIQQIEQFKNGEHTPTEESAEEIKADTSEGQIVLNMGELLFRKTPSKKNPF